jgi:hypothetical protein
MDNSGVENAMQWCRRSGKWGGREELFRNFVHMLQVRIRRCPLLCTLVFDAVHCAPHLICHDFHIPTDEQDVAISRKDLVISREIGAPLFCEQRATRPWLFSQ